MEKNLITCIVESGRADRIAETVVKAGAPGVTVLHHATGTGSRQKFGHLAMFIRPEKEIIFIVVKDEETTEKIFDLVIKEGGLDKPGKGFAFIQKVDKVVGFPEDIDLEAVDKDKIEGQMVA